jgi:hypothetical protein
LPAVLCKANFAADDSSSIEYAAGSDHKRKLLFILEAVAEIYGLAREKGIVSVQFLNDEGQKDVTPAKVANFRSDIRYGGVTMLGTQLQEGILDPFVLSRERMDRPLLTIIVTDGNVCSPVLTSQSALTETL